MTTKDHSKEVEKSHAKIKQAAEEIRKIVHWPNTKPERPIVLERPIPRKKD